MVSRLMKYFLAAIFGATAIMLLFYFADQGVLGMAAKYTDDEPTLIKFMSDMGYPKTGEWCGEFAARTGANMERQMQCPMSATLLWLIEVCRLVQQAHMLAS